MRFQKQSKSSFHQCRQILQESEGCQIFWEFRGYIQREFQAVEQAFVRVAETQAVE